MAPWLPSSWDHVVFVVAATVIIYALLLAMTRLSGLRSFATISAFDFAMTIAVGAVIPSTVLSGSASLVDGLVLMATLFVLQIVVALGRRHLGWSVVVDNAPVVLIHEGQVFDKNLRTVRLQQRDLWGKLREKGVADVEDVLLAVMETTGNVSVVPRTNGTRVDDRLLEDVDFHPKASHGARPDRRSASDDGGHSDTRDGREGDTTAPQEERNP